MAAVADDYDAVFREVFPRLVSLGVLRTGRLDVARDLAQETMLRAHARWGELVEYDAPAAWCRRVMTNLLIDHHRSAASERRAVERLGRDGDAARVDDEIVGPALDRWNELVDGLSDHQRLVVTLYYADDRSVGQIAELLGTTRGAVKATLFKARRRLRSELGDDRQTGGSTDG